MIPAIFSSYNSFCLNFFQENRCSVQILRTRTRDVFVDNKYSAQHQENVDVGEQSGVVLSELAFLPQSHITKVINLLQESGVPNSPQRKKNRTNEPIAEENVRTKSLQYIFFNILFFI